MRRYSFSKILSSQMPEPLPTRKASAFSELFSEQGDRRVSGLGQQFDDSVHPRLFARPSDRVANGLGHVAQRSDRPGHSMLATQQRSDRCLFVIGRPWPAVATA